MKKDRSTPPPEDTAQSPGDAPPGDAPPPDALQGKPKEDRVYVGTGFYWPVLLGLILVLATLALVLQNTNRVDVSWLWFDFRVPLIALLLATGLSAAVLTELVGWVWRRRRRRALRDREELKRLRG